MKFLIAIFVFVSAAALAQEPAMTIRRAGSRLDSRQTRVVPPVYHVFGDRPIQLDLSVEAPMGSKMNIRVDLIQATNSIAAPLQRGVALGDTITFEGMTHRSVFVTVPLPKIQRETKIIVNFQIKTGAKWTGAGQATFVVYSADALKGEMQDAIGAARIELFGGDKNLGDLLRSQKIKFDQGGAGLPENPEADCIYAGNATAKDLSLWLDAHVAWHGTLVVFCEDTDLQPGVYTEIRGGSRLIKVTLPVLDDLSSDPLAQKTLIKILNSITPHQTP